MIPIGKLKCDADGQMVELQADQMTHDLIVMEHVHHEIHEGDHFFVAGYGTFDAAADIDFQLTTPTSERLIHMTFSFQSTGATTLDIYEDANVAADGTAVTARNSNRNVTKNTRLTLLQYDGTVNAAGTLIYSQAWGYTNVPSQPRGGVNERKSEIVLKANSTYRFFVQSDSASNIISYIGDWYEHPNWQIKE